MTNEYLQQLFSDHQKASRCPSPAIVIDFFDKLLGFLFPEFSSETYEDFSQFNLYHESLKNDFRFILSKRSIDDQLLENEQILNDFFGALPGIKDKLKLDTQAIYEGDPAARSLEEVVRTYPGFYAIAAHRIAHHLFYQKLSLVARIISSHAHSKTGIDIHPAATIGNHFCMDHGTGVVIGETTEIGDHVKVYQGVTLGALSVRKEDAAKKRHPIIEDHVVIYAGATILGGKTRVGHHSVIGGNVWLTESVPPHTKKYYQANDEMAIREDERALTQQTES